MNKVKLVCLLGLLVALTVFAVGIYYMNTDASFPSSVIGTGEGANMLVSVFYTLNGYSAKTFGETLTAQAVRLNSGS